VIELPGWVNFDLSCYQVCCVTIYKVECFVVAPKYFTPGPPEVMFFLNSNDDNEECGLPAGRLYSSAHKTLGEVCNDPEKALALGLPGTINFS